MSDVIPPYLRAELHPSNNIDANSLSAKTSLLWQCSKGHSWQATLYSRINGTGCPYCKNRKLLKGFNDLETASPLLASEWHPIKNLPLTPDSVLYGSAKSVFWQCSLGHEWEAKIEARYNKKSGCPYCAGVKTLSGFNDLATLNPKLAREWHPTKNSPVLPNQVSSNTNNKFWWLGECGHEWESSISKRNSYNRGCPYCSNQKLLVGLNDLKTTHPSLAGEWHKDKNKTSPEQVITGGKEKFWWICKDGHEWQATINKRKQGSSCPICANQKIVPGINDLQTTNPRLSEEWDFDKNEVSITEIPGGTRRKVYWKRAQCGHSWLASVSERNGAHQTGCPKCPRNISAAEAEILDYVKKLIPDDIVESNTREAVQGVELDIYIPGKKIAFEYNGLYWHSEEIQKDKNYHKNKWRICKDAGVTLFQIWEDDYTFKKDIVLESIAQKMGVSTRAKIYARKTYPVTISALEAKKFLNSNHIQGYVESKNCVALKDKETHETVAVMLLKVEPRTNGKTLNLVRYATSKNVIGGFTKILKHVMLINPEVDSIITFSDNAVSDGGLYSLNGFEMVAELPADYSYVVHGKREHKFNYRLKKFRNEPGLKWQEGLTEKQLAQLNGLRRIWDAGKIKWIYRRN